jgi:sterol desaturase/sphingolipid hydroxylase (fatty acid hydroxylase superfamily)
MLLPNFFSVQGFTIALLVLFIIIVGRYFLVAGIFYAIFYKWFPEKWADKKINKKPYKKGQLKKEILWSITNAFIFSIIGAITLILWQKGFIPIYVKFSLNDIWYIPLSFFAYLFLQETYYYWLHRWMHLPRVFVIVHKVHHQSKISSPFTAFSFHPIEGFLQAIFLPILLLLIPIHLYVLILILIIMSITSVINHLNIEIYPKKSYRFLGKWVIGATHHSIHHTEFKFNFGLYFTFWDLLKKTGSPNFSELYHQMTRKQNKHSEPSKS